ncbi:MAG: YciI family protein [Asticcacaulis sp.]
MQFALLIYQTAEDVANRADPAYWAPWPDYGRALAEAGAMRGGEALYEAETAVTVDLTMGLVEDGPFADTKEQLGGFFLIDAPDLKVACDWAARMPSAPGRKVEVRPVRQLNRG